MKLSTLKPMTLFTLLAAGYLLSLPLLPFPGDFLLKAAPIFVLIGLAASSLQGKTRVLMVTALVFSSFGDITLALPFSWSFPIGLGNFLIAQAIYAYTFYRSGHWQSAKLPLAVVIALFAIGSASLLLPKAGDLAPAILVYVSAISLMGISAVFYRHNAQVLLGALLFMLSDSLIAINKFLLPFEASGAAIMITYYLAQRFILQGIISGEEAAEREATGKEAREAGQAQEPSQETENSTMEQGT